VLWEVRERELSFSALTMEMVWREVSSSREREVRAGRELKERAVSFWLLEISNKPRAVRLATESVEKALEANERVETELGRVGKDKSAFFEISTVNRLEQVLGRLTEVIRFP
jgi:hypothetical protein